MRSAATGQVALIGVDWGTSNLRVMRIGHGGVALDSRSDPRGAGQLQAHDFPAVLRDVVGDWLYQGDPILVCGMAGARGRWCETQYVPCPAALNDLAAALARPETGLNVGIVPGVAVVDDQGLVDVMRGEETQAMGMFDAGQDGLIVAPGTTANGCRLRMGGSLASEPSLRVNCSPPSVRPR
jgi:2-dehydro-3-deoxygalactonokinase